ncbi:MAG: nitroreductase, partial [Pseudomonadota bacterium]
MQVETALKTRISIRAFLDKPVPEASVRDILDTARWSPSGGNLQPWRMIVVSGAARDAVAEMAMKTLATNPLGEAEEFPIYPSGLGEPYRTRRYKVGEDLYALLGIPREDKAARLGWVSQNFNFFGAPLGLFFVIDRGMGNGQWAHLGMLMQSIALAAHAKGLATCMQEAWGMVRKSAHAHFGLAEHEVIYCGMALGYPDGEAAVNTLRSDRAEVSEIA